MRLLAKKRKNAISRKLGDFVCGEALSGTSEQQQQTTTTNNNNNKGRVPFRGPPIGTRAFLAHLTREIVDPYRRFKL